MTQPLPWYCAREDVKAALDSAETARNDAQVDREIEANTRSIESFLRRRLYPWTGVRYFDWPPAQTSRSWRLWLDANELISVSALVAGGVTVAATDYFLEPVNSGPPYGRVEIDLASGAAFASGSGTSQRAIAITGLYGYADDAAPAGTLAEGLDASETAVDVSDASPSTGAGVGHILKVDSERMIVTGKTMITTGQVLTGTSLTASAANVTVPVANGALFALGETILLDSERMLVVDIAGNNLTVKRAFDGTVLAAHTHTSTTIYAPRTLTVTRGALGTTAATHSTSAALTRWVTPGPARQLCIAESLVTLLQQGSGYTRTVSQGASEREAAGGGLFDLRAQVYASLGRKVRSRAV